jgi:hypothetical protein
MVALFSAIDELTWHSSQQQAATQPYPTEPGCWSDMETAVNAQEKSPHRICQPLLAPFGSDFRVAMILGRSWCNALASRGTRCRKSMLRCAGRFVVV